MEVLNTFSAAFVLNGSRVKIKYEQHKLQNVTTKLTVDLKPAPLDGIEHTLSGDMTGSGGQIADSLRQEATGLRHPLRADLVRLCDIWDAIHLNGMKAGTRAQMAALADMPKVVGEEHCHIRATTYLAECGLQPDKNTGGKPYAYGSGWLYQPVAEPVIAELIELLARLDGARLMPDVEREEAEEGEDASDAAPVVPDEASFSNSDDTLDSSDVIKRLEELREYKDAGGSDEDILAELAILEALESDGQGYGDWNHGATLVRESHFVEYAEQLADDLGYIKKETSWPYTHIDWEAAAEELKSDYTEIDFGGVTYLMRA